MNRDLELRKLPIGSLCSIVNILEIDHSWQKVMDYIPKDPKSTKFERKYNIEHMRLIQKHAEETKRKCAEILFDEWGTSGRNRPTVDTLIKVLTKAEIYRAADEIAIMLHEPLPTRPHEGPAARVNTNITLLLNGESMDQTQEMREHRLNELQNGSKNSKHTIHNQALHNGPTKQMKSASDLIKFSKDIYSGIKNKSSRQISAQMTSNDKDLIEFSKSGLATEDLPDFSALMANDKTIISSSTTSDKTSDSSEMSDITTEKTQSTNPLSYSSNGPHMATPSVDLYGVVDNGILEDSNLIPFEYSELEVITNNFTETLVDGPTGLIGKIGRGGFGEVFVGSHYRHGSLAVKKVRCYLQFDCKPEVAIKVFNAEVKSLSQLRHINIVPILGYSVDGPTPCIICKYIEGGSLEQKIAAKELSEKERMEIMLGTAEGLKYIHNTIKPVQVGNGASHPPSTLKTYFIHGDVKSANILLTKDCVPKLCDFGLAKQLESTYITSSMMGTSAYMPPEGFTGTITRKTDIFSFGIVMLELLTGLRPIVSSTNGNINIKNYVEENCNNEDITDLLDPVVEKWTKGQKVYSLARRCLELDRNFRPSMEEVSAILNRINHQESYEIFYARV